MGNFNTRENHSLEAVPHRLCDTMGVPQHCRDSESSNAGELVSKNSTKTINIEVASNEVTSRRTFETNPEDSAGVFSRWTYRFMNPLFELAQKKAKRGEELEPADMFPLCEQDQTRVLFKQFKPTWEKHETGNVKGAKLIILTLYSLLKRTLIWCIFISLVRSAVRFFYPVLVNLFLTFVVSDTSASGSDQWKGYLYCGLLALNTVASSLINSQSEFLALKAAIKARSVISTALFQKVLVLSQASRSSTTTGEIINHLQLYTKRISAFVQDSRLFVNNFIEVILFSGLVVYFIGSAAFAGLGILSISIPLNKWLIKRLYEMDEKVVESTDVRVKLTNETVQGMLGVKSAAWEEKLQERISAVRQDEIAALKKFRVYDATLEMMVGAAPSFAAAISVAVYSLAIGGPVSAPILFASIISFDRIRLPLVDLPDAINSAFQAYTSAKRLSGFLSLPEVNSEDMNPLKEDDLEPGVEIDIKDGTFYWAARSDELDVGMTPNNNEKKSNKINNKSEDDSEYSWTPVLSDISIKFRTGTITAIVGPVVGSGKSALVQVVLGELFREAGSVTVRGNSKTIAYCAQDPWILNATIRDNILFGQPLDVERLTEVVKVCQLEHDLHNFPAGMDTMIGEKGINLSGGQKARLSVARAAYSTASIVVMDNPLSALDPEVAGKLFEVCIAKYMSTRTRILVTNQLHMLKHCHWIVVLEAKSRNGIRESNSNAKVGKVPTTGRIQEQGTYNHLRNAGMEFATVLKRFQHAGNAIQSSSETIHVVDTENTRIPSDELEETHGGDNNVIEAIRGARGGDNNVIEATHGGGNNNALEASRGGDSYERTSSKSSEVDMQVNAGKNLMTDEERASGAVTLEAYKGYFLAFGGWTAASVVLLLICATRGAGFMSLKWVSFWTTAAESNYTKIDPLPHSTVKNADVFYSLVYLGFTILDLLFAFVAAFVLLTFALHAAERLHDALLTNVFRCTMEFFDTTPIGRIMNRFSKDLSVVDHEIVNQIWVLLLGLSFTVTSVIALTSIMPYFAISIIPFGILFYGIFRRFRPVHRAGKRLESISQSPLFANFSQVIGGTTTIRAYKSATRFEEYGKDLVDNVSKFRTLRYAAIWLTFRMECLGAMAITVVGVLAIQGSQSGWLRAGDIGLSFQYADILSGMLQFALYAFADLEGAMTSVERILYYRDRLPQERAREPDDEVLVSGSKNLNPIIAVPGIWPSDGAIEVSNLRMRYRKHTPLVLKGVTFSVRGGERIGICGRTGSGKSSLIKSLLRLVEPDLGVGEAKSHIIVDGIDILHIGLGPLRRAISVVSQDPTIFSGSIRMNLDPFDEYSDAEVWSALDHCGLRTFVSEAPGKLQMQVSEFGSNLSQGQRQLLVLAMCLLKQSKILLLDESTASLDFEADAQIQKAIRSTFSECTVLVIAHRIRTIIDSDKILVMEDGKVAEYDTPANLLANKSSHFYGMAKGQAIH